MDWLTPFSLFVGLALAAYTLPGAVGALVLGRYLGHRPARALVLAHCLLRTAFLGAIAGLGLDRSLRGELATAP